MLITKLAREMASALDGFRVVAERAPVLVRLGALGRGLLRVFRF